MHILETADQRGSVLQVEFAWRGDRFGHQIVLRADGQRWLLASSVEGSSDDRWPASPPVQEIHQQGDVLFLTGKSGDSYWSASVTVQSTGAIGFDVACRAKTTSEWLGSRYRTDNSGPRRIAAPQSSNALVTATDDGWTINVPTSQSAPAATMRWSYLLRAEHQ